LFCVPNTYDKTINNIEKDEERKNIPIQSTLKNNRRHTGAVFLFGKQDQDVINTKKFGTQMKRNPQRQPIVPENIPPKVRPILKPTDCPPPIAAIAKFLRMPGGNTVPIILTADDKHKEAAMPPRPRKTISWVPDRDRLQPSANIICSEQPKT
jgi:hypothetical protein